MSPPLIEARERSCQPLLHAHWGMGTIVAGMTHSAADLSDRRHHHRAWER